MTELVDIGIKAASAIPLDRMMIETDGPFSRSSPVSPARPAGTS
jgi:Tat protein secretion system quality control protein TatD with DNase activity